MKNLILCLFLMGFANFLKAQTQITIKPETAFSTGTTLSPYLNGIARNHYSAYLNEYDITSYGNGQRHFENQLNNKLTTYKNIQNNFGKTDPLSPTNPSTVYRIGHNISDGNFDYDHESQNIGQSGWHWATDYKSLGDPNVVFQGDAIPSSNPVQYSWPQTNLRLGAGVHRFYFKYKNLKGAKNPSTDQSSDFQKNLIDNKVLDSKLTNQEVFATIPALTDVDYLLYTFISIMPNKDSNGNFTSSTTGGIKIEYYDSNNILLSTPTSTQYTIGTAATVDEINTQLKIVLTPPANATKIKMSPFHNAGGFNVRIESFRLIEMLERYSGFTATVNYANSAVTTGNIKSKTIELTPHQGLYFLSDIAKVNELTVPVSGTKVRAQVGGPEIKLGAVISAGIYEITYRITDTSNGNVSYYGFILCINPPIRSFKIYRMQDDLYYELALPTPMYDTANFGGMTDQTILNDHSKVVSVNAPMVVLSGATNSNLFINNVANTESRTDYTLSSFSTIESSKIFRATHFQPESYDNLQQYINEATTLNADLAIVLNIATGYPEEALGLIAYLKKKTTRPIAYVELGSELMGYWTKGSYLDLFNTPTELGAATKPFAKKIKDAVTSTNLTDNSSLSSTKIATTSTFNITIDFSRRTSAPSNPETSLNTVGKIQKWLEALKDGNTVLVDYINLHNYSPSGTAVQKFDENKVRHLLGVNQIFSNETLSDVQKGIDLVSGASNVKVVLTESNSADRSTELGAEFTTPINRLQQTTMTEGMFFAETFLVAGQKNIRSITPFAFTYTAQEQINYDGLNPAYADNTKYDGLPTQDFFKIHQCTDFDVLFYPNNNDLFNWSNNNEIITKPMFKVKKLIAENLGNTVFKADKIKSSTIYDADLPLYSNGNGTFTTQSVEYDELGILVTKNSNEAFYRVLVINRSLPGSPGVNKLIIFNLLTTAGNTPSIISISGNSIYDKNPIPSGTTFSNITDTNGGITIPKFSVCILKVFVSPPTTPSLSLAIGNTTVTEKRDNLGANYIVKVPITLSKPHTSIVTVSYATAVTGTATSGSDFVAKLATQVTFPINTTTSFAEIELKQDNLLEDPETINLTLSAPSLGVSISNGNGVITILDNTADPEISILQTDQTITEDALSTITFNFTIPVIRKKEVVFSFSTVNGTAKGDNDFLPVTLKTVKIPIGQTTVFETINLLSDNCDEIDTESFEIEISNPVNAKLPTNPKRKVSINDNDANNCSFSAVAENNTIVIRGLCAPNVMILITGGNIVNQFICDGTCPIRDGTFTFTNNGYLLPATYNITVTFKDASGVKLANCTMPSQNVTIGSSPYTNCTGTQLIDNPGFEANTGWVLGAGSVYDTPGNTLNMTGKSGAIFSGSVSQTVTNGIIANNEYKLAFWAQHNGTPTTGNVSILFKNSSGIVISASTATLNVQLTQNWKYYSISKIAPIGVASIEIKFEKTTGTGGCVRVDDVCLTNGISTNPCLPDLTAPVITGCPANISKTTTTTTATWTAPAATDNCSGIVTWTSTHTSGASFPIGTTTVTYTAKDVANNTATCSFTVIVTSSAITCTLNKLLNPGFESQATSWSGYVAPANSTYAYAGLYSAKVAGSGGTLYQTLTLLPGKTMNLLYNARGENTSSNIYAYIKYMSNTYQTLATESFNFQFTSNSYLAAAPLTKLSPANTAFVEIGFINQGTGFVYIDDVCLSENVASNPCLPDLTAPVFTTGCPANISKTTTTTSSTATWTAPTATDNCTGAVTLTSTHISGTSFPIGITIVTYTAKDVVNNAATCSFTVTVTQIQPAILSINSPTLSENTGPANLTISSSQQSTTANPITVTCSLVNGIATSGSDYTVPTILNVTIPNGLSTAVFSVPLIDNTVVEPNETFTVNLINPINATIATGGGGTGTVTIKDNDCYTNTLGNTNLGSLSTQGVSTTNATYNNIIPGASYYVNATISGSGSTNPTGGIDVKFMNSSFSPLTAYADLLKGTPNGLPQSILVVAPAGSSYLEIRIRKTDTGTGSITVPNVCVNLSPTSLTSNSSNQLVGHTINDNLIVVNEIDSNSKEGSQVEYILYPNPAGESVSIKIPVSDQATNIQFVNQLGIPIGKQISFLTPNEAASIHEISLQGIDNGMYFLRIETAGQREVVRKLVVSRMY
jgi:HYR domain/Secretion system C-terminal sorting domain/Calx-beta domain